MRIDRFITLQLIRPARLLLQRPPQPDVASRPLRPVALPILMYHSVSDDPESGTHPYYKACTSPRHFAEQMQWLAQAGWTGVTLARGLTELARNAPGADRLVAITFDDGFRDFQTAAIPALQRHGFAATMYLPTAYIGDRRRSFQSRECLTWDEIRALQAAGTEFGSHTVSHPKLVESSWTDIERELGDSKREIEQRLGSPVASFAYPYAFPQARTSFARRFCDLVKRTGYTNCVTTIIGRTRVEDDPFQLPRLPVNDADDERLLAAKVEGSYDWLAAPQRWAKTLRNVGRTDS